MQKLADWCARIVRNKKVLTLAPIITPKSFSVGKRELPGLRSVWARGWTTRRRTRSYVDEVGRAPQAQNGPNAEVLKQKHALSRPGSHESQRGGGVTTVPPSPEKARICRGTYQETGVSSRYEVSRTLLHTKPTSLLLDLVDEAVPPSRAFGNNQ